MIPEVQRLGDMFSWGASQLSGPEIRAHTASCFMGDEDAQPAENARVARPGVAG